MYKGHYRFSFNSEIVRSQFAMSSKCKKFIDRKIIRTNDRIP